MINPNENESTNNDPLTVSPAPVSSRPLSDNEETRPAASSADIWEQTKERASQARERTEFFVRENPIPTIVAALGIGLAIGWALRHATTGEEQEIEAKSPIGNLNWSFLSLPFLFPFFKSLRERYEESAETVKDGVGRLKNIDIAPYTKPIRKRWKAWTR
jgi:hypothetical protein